MDPLTGQRPDALHGVADRLRANLFTLAAPATRAEPSSIPDPRTAGQARGAAHAA